MKHFRWLFVSALTLVALGLCVTIWLGRDTPEYHFSRLAYINEHFNSHQPTWLERRAGLTTSNDILSHHLRRLVELGALEHRRLEFDDVPYTTEASKRILKAVRVEHPSVVWWTTNYYAPEDPGYGVVRFAMEVWDKPEEFQRWSAFMDKHNRADP